VRLAVAGLMTAVLAAAHSATAQDVDGYASVMFDVLPDVEIATAESASARRTVAELRTRVFAERRFDLGGHVRVTAAGFVEGLAARRAHAVSTALLRPQELHAEVLWSKADLRVGYSRVVWGRLDEFLPTDVVNPLDVARFFLEGRAEARMPVAMVRGRITPSERFSLDALYVPVFRRGRFDQLEEDSSPFNLTPVATGVLREPRRSWSNAQGGVRANVTTGRVDWSVSAYRGFEPLPLSEVRFGMGVPVVEGRFPRFTMVGGDFETVHGAWGFRGEVAAFVERTLQLVDQPLTAEGHAFEAGLGADRKAGAYRVSANVVVSGRTAARSAAVDERDTLVVASLDRSFAGETRNVRAFAVYNPGEDSAFARFILSFKLRDNVALETSAGWFAGDGVDAFSRLATRDFVYARLKVFF
jgi:Protein of unknown function (DUF1302)